MILTTTDDPQEIARCYHLGCNGFVTKPVAYPPCAEAMRTLDLLMSIVQLPKGRPYQSLWSAPCRKLPTGDQGYMDCCTLYFPVNDVGGETSGKSLGKVSLPHNTLPERNSPN